MSKGLCCPAAASGGKMESLKRCGQQEEAARSTFWKDVSGCWGTGRLVLSLALMPPPLPGGGAVALEGPLLWLRWGLARRGQSGSKETSHMLVMPCTSGFPLRQLCARRGCSLQTTRPDPALGLPAGFAHGRVLAEDLWGGRRVRRGMYFILPVPLPEASTCNQPLATLSCSNHPWCGFPVFAMRVITGISG